MSVNELTSPWQVPRSVKKLSCIAAIWRDEKLRGGRWKCWPRETGRERHTAASVQVRHCLGMRATMQAHSAAAGCGGGGGTDLPRERQQGTSDLWGSVSGSARRCQQTSVSQACVRNHNHAMANPQDFYQRFNSLDTSLVRCYWQIPVGWFKELFPTSQFAFVQ